MIDLRFRVLGPVEAERRGDLVVIGGRGRAALVTLLLHGGAPVPGERLVDALWGDDPPGSPATALRLARQARGELGGRVPAGGPGSGGARVPWPCEGGR